MPTRRPQHSVRPSEKQFPEMLKLISGAWLLDLVAMYSLDKWTKKLYFIPFLRFLLLIILKQTKKISLRRLAHASKDPYYQQATGIQAVEFSNIGQRLRKIPREVWEKLWQATYRLVQSRDGRFKRFATLLKWFDTTTISMSAKRCQWAAKSEYKRAVRVAIRCDDRTDKVELIVNGSANMSDNTIFQKLLVNAPKGSLFVFDAGFSKLLILKNLVDRGSHFISMKSRTFSTEILYHRPLPKKCEVAPNWVVFADYRAIVGSVHTEGRNDYRCVLFYNWATHEFLELFTNLTQYAPQRLFTLYHRRWRVEVIFRWLKSEFALTRIPAFNEQGVWAWIFLNLIAYLLLRYWQDLHEPIPKVRQWSARDAFGWFQRQFNQYFFAHLEKTGA